MSRLTSLGDYFVGERTRVYIATGTRQALVVPDGYLYRRAGVDYVRLADGNEIVVQPGMPGRRGRRRNPRRAQGRRRGGEAMKLGLSGFLTRTFINSPLTPLLLLAALVVGALALFSLPREEEPQISVPMVDILVTANGYKAGEAVELSPARSKTSSRASTASSTSIRRPQDDRSSSPRAFSSAPTRTPRCCGFTRRSAPISPTCRRAFPSR